MKQLFKTFFITTIIFFSIVLAAKASIISDEIQNSLLINNKEKMDLIIDENNRKLQEYIDYYTAYYNFLGRGQDYIDSFIREANYKYTPILKSGFAYHLLEIQKYGYQYAQNHCFDDLISDDKIWIIRRQYMYDGHFKDLNTDVVDMNITSNGLIRYTPSDLCDFLIDTDNIEKIVAESVDEEIIDCKIIYLTAGVFMLYLKGEETDYGMKFYHGERFQDYEQSFELYKVYKLSDLLENFANADYCKQPEMMEEKSMYTAEAEALNSAGILQGTENGLELLKPLNRIEATTILVRILGLENNQTSDTSYFNDIPNDNWGVKYANII